MIDRARGHSPSTEGLHRGWLALALFAAALALAGCGGQGGGAAVVVAPPPPPFQGVLTYHYDNSRSGWNDAETALSPSAVAGAGFGLKHTVALDEQVDTQPLVVSGLSSVGGQPTQGDDVVYVATENNTVYAIDGATGTVLLSKNFGAPLSNPQGCNNTPLVGINSTPVIDRATNTMYVMTYTNEATGPTYRLHALDITTLQDKANVVVTASHALEGGGSTVFNAAVQRQRAALLDYHGVIYAGFASFCDFAASQSRGWLLGWQTGSLRPLAANQLNNTQPTGGFYLSSIWMSGGGPAVYNGAIVVATGNSNPNGQTWDASAGTNFSESVIKLSPDLTKVTDWFTPTNFAALEADDVDLGAGGVLIIPGSAGAAGSGGQVVAAGKDGVMYVLSGDQLGHGGPSPPSPAPAATPSIGYCWCGESYYVGPHGPTIVSSGGGNPQDSTDPSLPDTVQLWAISTSAGGTVSVVNAGVSEDIGGTPQDGGFFTSVSSAGFQNAVIWALSRPDGTLDAAGQHDLYLYAFSETVANGKLTRLFKGRAGAWADGSMNGNSNLVPVVDHGRVYVASYRQLNIFGLN